MTLVIGLSRQRFLDSPITRVIGSDTYPGRVSDELLDIYSVAPLIARVLRKQLKLP
jgi:ribose-phosphate pyrophosphokinase